MEIYVFQNPLICLHNTYRLYALYTEFISYEYIDLLMYLILSNNKLSIYNHVIIIIKYITIKLLKNLEDRIIIVVYGSKGKILTETLPNNVWYKVVHYFV